MNLQRGALAAVSASVERLRIRDTGLPSEVFEGLAQSDAGGHAVVSRLKEIDLSDSATLKAIEVCSITKAWPHISTLKLNGCVNTKMSPTYRPLSQVVQNLETLEADGVHFESDDLAAIFQNTGGNLRRLSIAGCQSHDDLDLVEDLPNLRSLNISGCGSCLLFGLDPRQALDELEANGVPLSDENVSNICRNHGGTLHRLGIARCFLTRRGASLIASSLTSLQSLDISGCRTLSDADFMVFANLGETLRFLNVSATKVSNDTVDRLKVALPNCEIVH